MAQLLRGAPVAQALCRDLSRQTEELRGSPTLALLRVGEKPGDLAYERAIAARCAAVGVTLRRCLLPDTAQLLPRLRQLNADESVHGVLLLRPLPDRAAEEAACRLLAPHKDVDGMTPGSLAGLLTGSGGFAPCTAQAVLELLDYYGVAPEGRRAVVIGRSLVVGQPTALLLQARNATVTLCHRHTRDLPDLCRQADILISAAGRPGLVDERFVRPGQVVVDVGVAPGPDGTLLGDVAFERVEPIVSALTPRSGGVGAVTASVLMKHCIAACRSL